MADVNLSTTETLAIHETDVVSALAKTTPTTLVEYLIAGETIFPSGVTSSSCTLRFGGRLRSSSS